MLERQIHLWTIVGVMVTVLVLVAGCGSSGKVELGAQDNGRQIEVRKGQTLVVTLDSNPSTGYSWERTVAEDGVLKQVGAAEFREQKRDQQLVGVGGQEVLRFKAVAAGQTRLELVYHRPWEKGEKPVETFVVDVTVQ